MVTNTIGRQSWTLTIVRDFKSSLDEEIEWEKFYYGRTSEELEDKERTPKHLPSGLVYLLARANLISEALESGFVTEMSSYPKIGDDWIRFERIAMASIVPPFGPTVARYAVEDGEDLISVGTSTIYNLDESDISYVTEGEISLGKNFGLVPATLIDNKKHFLPRDWKKPKRPSRSSLGKK